MEAEQRPGIAAPSGSTVTGEEGKVVATATGASAVISRPSAAGTVQDTIQREGRAP